jgi:DNA invertase Pin-like site-specific DNA recombinase
MVRKREPHKCIGYIRCSTDKQAASGLGLAGQRAAIEEAARQKGWELLTIVEDAGVSGAGKKRPTLEAAIGLIEAGGADTLLAAKLDRLSRSLIEFLGLVKRAQDNGWNLVVLDRDLDMTTSQGRLLANILASFAEYERDILRERTRTALDARRAAGKPVGRPAADEALVRRIAGARARGESLPAIARQLNEEGVPTPQGGKQWWPSTIAAVLLRQAKESQS